MANVVLLLVAQAATRAIAVHQVAGVDKEVTSVTRRTANSNMDQPAMQIQFQEVPILQALPGPSLVMWSTAVVVYTLVLFLERLLSHMTMDRISIPMACSIFSQLETPKPPSSSLGTTTAREPSTIVPPLGLLSFDE